MELTKKVTKTKQAHHGKTGRLRKAEEKEMEIEETSNGSFAVTSERSDKQYTVHSRTRIARDSGSMYFVWTCNCPARKRCRHIDAVEDFHWQRESEAVADDDYDGIAILERFGE